MKKSVLMIALLGLISFLAGCGGGTGSSSTPTGVNQGVASVVQLLPIQTIAQTNSSIYLKAKVLDGNGSPLQGTQVTFTNLSLTGVLSATTAPTDQSGMATVTLFSPTPGFATVQAEVGSGAADVRDKKTVFFSVFDFSLPGQTTVPTLTLAVDSNNDGIYNEPSDFYLTSGEAVVRATVLDETGTPVLNDTVIFGADSTEVTFPDGASKQTNSAGEAFARVQVVPSGAGNFDIPVNVNAASTTTGASNVLTVFVTPIEVGQIAVIANPPTVPSGGNSTISATALTTAGALVPDGTTVNFMASSGVVVPFGQTTKGVATAAYTAPTLPAGSPDRNVTISATAGGKQGTASVRVTAPTPTPPPAVAVIPTSASIHCEGNIATFTVTDGTPPFVVYPSVTTSALTLGGSPALSGDPPQAVRVISIGGTFNATSAACADLPAQSSTPVSVIVKDDANHLLSVLITVTNP